VIAPGGGRAYLGFVIRSAALLARRVAGLPDRLARGLAVLALLVLATAAVMAMPAEVARAEGPACTVAGVPMAILSGTPDAQPETERSGLGRTDLCAADTEILTELGLPRPPVEAPRPRHTVSASFDHRSDAEPASAPDGALHRPPRLA
jgi:Tfp pilus assembly protein FimV